MSSIEVAGGIQQATVKAEIGMAVAKKMLDSQKQQGEAALKLLESAQQLVKETGKGNQVDTLA